MAVEVGWTLMRRLLWQLICDVLLLLAIGGFVLLVVVSPIGAALLSLLW